MDVGGHSAAHIVLAPFSTDFTISSTIFAVSGGFLKKAEIFTNLTGSLLSTSSTNSIMSSNRRNFLRHLAIGSGALMTGIPSFASSVPSDEELKIALDQSKKSQRFNMSGYAAPKIDKVRIGFIGQGMRGPGAVQRMSYIDGVEIVALCDLLPERATKSNGIVTKSGRPAAKEYSGENGWKEMIDKEKLDWCTSPRPGSSTPPWPFTPWNTAATPLPKCPSR